MDLTQPPPPEKAYLTVVTCMLSLHSGISVSHTQTISWAYNVTEDEARGRATKFALEAKPGYSIDMITVTLIPPPTKVEPHGGENKGKPRVAE